MKYYKLVVDTGGTFTDLCLKNQKTGELTKTKVPSTPEDPSLAVFQGINTICNKASILPENIDIFIHGNTIATNALLEGKGKPAALVTTEGFKDILHIGRQERPHLYNPRKVRSTPPISRDLIFEAGERMAYGGKVLKPLDLENAGEIANRLKKINIESVAICFLHSYSNPEHERKMADIIKEEIPGAYITVSGDVFPEIREYERTCIAAANALVQPLMNIYLEQLQKRLSDTGFKGNIFIVQSNGGVMTTPQTERQCIKTVLSGPAAGVKAGEFISRITGRNNIITADMGGTSTDMSVLKRGKPEYTRERTIGNHHLYLPMLDIHTVGAGGGSIARVDSGGALKVGPYSAGSIPGPACYGKGGSLPTVTDANAVLGRLVREPSVKEQELNNELSRRVIKEKIAAPHGLSAEEAAEGIIRVINSSIIRSMKVLLAREGHNPGEFTLMAFGGNGPLHAVEFARELGCPHVLIPPAPGVTSASGMLSADVQYDYVKNYMDYLKGIEPDKLNEQYNRLEDKARTELSREGFSVNSIEIFRFIDLRYRGQSYELTLEIPTSSLIPGDIKLLLSSFHQSHNQQYGYLSRKTEVEIVALRLSALGRLSNPATGKLQKNTHEPPHFDSRTIIFNGEKINTPVYNRDYFLDENTTISGPAVIEQQDSTTLLWPGDKVRCDGWGNLIIEVRTSDIH